MTKLAAFLVPALLLATAATAFAQDASAPPPPAPDQASGPVVVVSPGPVVVTAPTTAPAAPTTAPATTVPENTDWNDVSHINGQIVKVGESDDYRKSYRRTNISTNPIGWILGSYSVSASYGVTNNIAIRGDVGFVSDYMVDNTTGFSAGISAPLYLKRTYRGAFVEPGLRFMRAGYSDSCSGCGSSVTVGGPEVLVGWHWTWDSGFNVSLAFGVGRNWSSDNEYSKIFPDGYFRIGYALGGSRK